MDVPGRYLRRLRQTRYDQWAERRLYGLLGQRLLWPVRQRLRIWQRRAKRFLSRARFFPAAEERSRRPGFRPALQDQIFKETAARAFRTEYLYAYQIYRHGPRDQFCFTELLL